MNIENKGDRHGMHIVSPPESSAVSINKFSELENLINFGGQINSEILEEAQGITAEQRSKLFALYTKKLETEKKTLEEERGIDSLTGISKEPEKHLKNLIKELNFPEEQRQSALSAIVVVFIDLNRFKNLNDTYGHAAGDEALKTFTDRLKEVIQEGTDLIFRPHGDEFVVIFPIKNNRVNVEKVFERIFQRMQKRVNDNLSVKIEGYNTNFYFSASMGYAVLKKGDSRTAEELLHEADLKMYKDKNGTR